jgi:hypothetical protein
MPDKNLMETEIKPRGDEVYLGVQDKPNYIREPYSKAIIPILSDQEIDDYLEKKKLISEQTANAERLNSLEHDLKDIKSLLTQLINK